jgi:hypothetical protein
MSVIFMDKPGTDKPIVLARGLYYVGIHHQPRQQFGLIERVKTYGYCNADQNNSYAHGQRVENKERQCYGI